MDSLHNHSYIFDGLSAFGDETLRDSVVLPAVVQTVGGEYIVPKNDIHRYMTRELDVSRLNRMHQYLWLASLPRGARPLHRQIMMERQIVVTEQADLHLVWIKSRIFIKPLPRFLLVAEHWRRDILEDETLRQSAFGFLLSYAWLVSRRSDLKIAQDHGLLPSEIEWEQWVKFIEAFLQQFDTFSTNAINMRYRYGELRLSRLNLIYRCSMENYSLRHFGKKYFRGPAWYSQFLKNNFGWLIAVVAYLSIILSAMQVGLATPKLSQEAKFVSTSTGFAVFSVAMPIIVLGIVVIISVVSTIWTVMTIRSYNQDARRFVGLLIGPEQKGPNALIREKSPHDDP